MLIYILFLFSVFLFMFIDMVSFSTKNNTLMHLDNERHLTNKDKRLHTKFSYSMICALIIIYLFSAFRFDVGWDYYNYYRTIKYGHITNIISLNEYATIFLVKISQRSGITNIYFAINSFICIFLIAKTIKLYSYDRWLSLIFFVCFPLFYLNSFSVIRMFSAVAITFYGFKFIENKSFFKYTLTVLIASMFHKSAIIAIILYFAAHYIKIKTSKLVIIFISLPIISNIFQTIVLNYFPRYRVYFNPSSIQEGTKAIIVFVAIAIVALICRKKVVNKDKAANLYFNIYFVGVAIYLAFMEQGTLGHRFSLYGTIYSLLLVPKLISLFGEKKERMILRFIIYILCILMLLFTVNVGSATYIPYRTIFYAR